MDKSFADLNSVKGAWFQVVESGDSFCADESVGSFYTVKPEEDQPQKLLLPVTEDPFEVCICAVYLFGCISVISLSTVSLFVVAGRLCSLCGSH